MITPLHIIFYFFATVAVGSALIVVTARNTVYSALALVLTFFAMACTWMLLHAEFLALILLLVYVGAVMTLFLFVIMMLNVDIVQKRSAFVRYLPFGIMLVILITGLIMFAVSPAYFGIAQMPLPTAESADYSNTRNLGALLYDDYAYAFEIAGVLLLAAIIAAISLTFRGPLRRKVQSIKEQISVTPESRVRLVKMQAERIVPSEKGSS